MKISGHSAEPASFEQVFEEHAPFAWRVLRRFGVAESDLPDACQDAFIVVHRKLHDFEGRSHLRTWLYRICARVASDYRKRAHRRYETEPLSVEPAVGSEQQRTVELAELCALLERSLDGLDDDKRQVFVLYELEDLPMTQIAELLGCPLKTAFSRLYVARERVNAALRRAGCAALIVALDPVPMRSLAQPPLASALDATGLAAPSVEQLRAQLSVLGPKVGVASAPAMSALLSTGALVAVTTLVLTFAPVTAPATPMPDAAGFAARTASFVDEPRNPSPAADVPVVAQDVPVASPPVTKPLRRAPAARSKVVRRVATTSAAAAVEQPPTDEPSVSTPWIEAPPTTPPSSVARATVSGTGLDEVLSATSIRSLMRVGPRPVDVSNHGATDHAWALLPDAHHARTR